MSSLNSERGSTLLLLVGVMVALLGMAALAIDVGHLFQVRTRLQATADAAALAAAQEIPRATQARTVAREYATFNERGDSTVLGDEDVVLGRWDDDRRVFAPGGAPVDAVQVTVARAGRNGNPVSLWFARVLGIREADVSATAIAVNRGGGGSRFLIDDEMIDSDEPEIEALAAKYGVKPEDIISDRDGDWFIDLPPGEVLDLPTGQVGDEALFDSGHSEFPFTSSSSPSHADFLNYNEDSNSWRYHKVRKEELDPLVGVSRVDDPSKYPSYVNLECQVSPVYKSDISALNPVRNSPAVNALGLRRGLMAFKILSVGDDPDGPGGSVLPHLIIEICPPIPIENIRSAREGGGGVRLVR